jgi:hypothetical protein
MVMLSTPDAAAAAAAAAAAVQALMFLSLACKAISGTNAFTGCIILVNAVAPKDSLGAVNGAGQSLASLVRALGPALGGLSWGWSLQLAELAWWPRWLPHQFLPFAAAGALALATDIVYWHLSMPEGEEAGSGGHGSTEGKGQQRAGSSSKRA